jgi:hypothetical protein
MRLETGLIAFGALSIPIFQVSGVLKGQAATAAFGIATAMIGAGPAMLSTGAAASASARILRSLPDQDAVANDQHSAPAAGLAMARSRAGVRPARTERTRRP